MIHNITSNQKYTDPEHEAYIKQTEEELIAHASLQGEQNGKENKPKTLDEFRVYLLNQLQTKIQKAINYNHQVHQPVSGLVVAQAFEQEANHKVKIIGKDVAEKEHQLQQLQRSFEELKPFRQNYILRVFVIFCLTLIACSDGWLSYPAFRCQNMPVIASILSSLGVAITVGIGAHLLGGYIRNTNEQRKKKIRYFFTLIIYFIGFLALGMMRVNAYSTAANLDVNLEQNISVPVSHVPVLALTLTSFFMFWLGLFLSIRFWTSKEELAKQQEYLDRKDAVEKAISEINTQKVSIERIEAEKNCNKAEALHRYEYALANEARLISIASQAIEKYIEKNMRFRTDNLCPHFFSQIPRLSFTTFFDKLTNSNNHETNTIPTNE